jgi:hypothetical protein
MSVPPRVQLRSIGGPGEGVYDVRLDGQLIGRVLSWWAWWEASAQPYGEGPRYRARLRRDAVGMLASACERAPRP